MNYAKWHAVLFSISFFGLVSKEEGLIVAVLPRDPDADETDVDIVGAVAASVEVTIYDED